ncbi:MAG: hypothetical protein WB767_09775 [Nocardioides sp.]
MPTPDTPPAAPGRRSRHAAGVLDIRNVIGALLSLYGVILLVTRVVEGDEGGARTEGLNANLWAGLALLAVGIGFLLWARMRPVVVPEAAPDSEKSDGAPGRATDPTRETF